MSVRLTAGNWIGGVGSASGLARGSPIEPVISSARGSRLAKVYPGVVGIRLPSGCGKLKVAACTVPNGVTRTYCRQRSDIADWRAISAAKS